MIFILQKERKISVAMLVMWVRSVSVLPFLDVFYQYKLFISDSYTIVTIVLGSAFMLGRALTSILWGIIADRYGRKPVVMVGIISV